MNNRKPNTIFVRARQLANRTRKAVYLCRRWDDRGGWLGTTEMPNAKQYRIICIVRHDIGS